MKYQAIEACKAEFPVSRLCAVLNIAESGYYAWLNRALSPGEQENRELQQTICTVWKQYRGIYGAPRIHAELQEQGISAGHNRIARLMRQAGIRGKPPANVARTPPSRIQPTRWSPMGRIDSSQPIGPMKSG